VCADPGGQSLPRPGRQAGGQFIDPPPALADRDAPVAGDGQHVADFPVLKGAAQGWVGAVDLVAGDPARGDAGVQGGGDHVRGQGRLGGEADVRRDAGGGAPVGVVHPPLGQVQGPVDQGVPGRRGVGQVHRDLGVLHPSGGPGVLTLHTHGLVAALEVAGLVDHEHGVLVAQVIGHVTAQVVPHPVGIPDRPGQQMLQPVRGSITAVLGDRPTVLPAQVGHQPQHQRGGTSARLVAGEPRGNAVPHLTEAGPPSVRVYAMRRGHRAVLCVRHKHRMIARWPP
jgi:hypothetical protein